MGCNQGFIFIRTERTLTATRVAELVSSYWLALGATVETTDFLVLEHDALADGRLAYAIVPMDDLWICLTDSMSYPHRGAALAAFLAGALETQVSLVEAYEVCDPPVCDSERHYGTDSPEEPPNLFTALDYRALCQDDASDLAAHLGVDMETIRYVALRDIPGPLPSRRESVVYGDDIPF